LPFVNVYPDFRIYDKNRYAFGTMRCYSAILKKRMTTNKCETCGSLRLLNIHHKNKDIWDNRRENLSVLCSKCHFKEDFPDGKPFFKGKHHSDYSKELLRKINIGKKYGEETRLKLSKVHKGKPFSEEHKRKISEALKGKIRTKEHCRNISIAKLKRGGEFYGIFISHWENEDMPLTNVVEG
jgi:hypothetical protein